MRRPTAIAAIGSIVVAAAVVAGAAPADAAAPAAPVLALGLNNGFAVHNGVLYGWGNNDSGSVGDGTEVERHIPVRVVGGALPSGVSIVQLSAGADHVLALGSNGKAYAWGDNSADELGNDSIPSSSTPVAVPQGAIPAGVRLVKVVAGDDVSWALGGNGTVYTWGGGTVASPVAVGRGAVPAGVKIVDLAASVGGDVVLAGSTGRLYAFGPENGEDQLGRTNMSFTSQTPVAVAAGAIPAGVRITRVAAASNTFYALGGNGKVYAWGEGQRAELGNGSTKNTPTPVAVKPGAIPAGVKIVQVVGLFDGALALGGNGKAYVWGDNDDNAGVGGELGDGNTVSTRPTPVALAQGVIPAGVRVVEVASDGSVGGAALGSDGNVYTWGVNEFGQLGDGSTVTPRLAPRRVRFATIDTRTTLTVTGTRRFGATITLTARVIPADTAGTVRFTSGSTALGSVKITSGSGTAARVATLRTARLMVGRHALTAAFTPSSPAKYTSSRSSVTITVAKGALRAGTPRVTGVLRVGRVVTAQPGAWTAGTRFAYQWLANGRAIAGAHARTLHLTKALRGKKIRVRVTGSKPNFSTVSKTSNPTVAVKPA